MESVINVLSKFKSNLDNILNDYNSKVSDIEQEEKFIQTLGDVVNYSKSDCLLLPFYDETILNRVLERVFPLSSEKNKIKTAKYLIEASKKVDKEQFPQYNNAVKDLEEINTKLSEYYNNLLSDESLKNDKENYLNKIDSYESIINIIEDDNFTALIENIDILEETVKLCNLSNEEINELLNIAINSNLKYLDETGIIINDDNDIINMKNENDKIQEEIRDLSNLLGNDWEALWNLKIIWLNYFLILFMTN